MITTAPAATVDVNHAYELQADSCGDDHCWGRRLVGWQAGGEACSNGVRVGMIDTAVDTSQPALRDSRILATRSPAASDLRLIVAVIKTITDLERIGDEAEKIGYIGSRLAAVERPADRYRELKHLGRVVGDMLHEALDAFARLDAEGAVAVAKKDRLVDEEYEAIQRQCITFMMEDPRTIRRVIDVLWVARALERIGDHAKNVCEYVVYMVYGKDIRHLSLEDVEKHVQSRSQRAPVAPDSH